MLPNGIGDAIECASTYRNLTAMHDAMIAAIKEQGAHEVFGHGSHFYPTGGNLYIIWSAFAESEREIESKYWRIMDAAMKAVISVDGTIGHHHGIGVNKGPWIHLDAAHHVAGRAEDQGRVGSQRHHEPRQGWGYRQRRYG